MDKQKPHRDGPGPGLSSFDGVFADKSAIGGRTQPDKEAEEKQEGRRAAFEQRLETIVMGAVDQRGSKIRNPFVKRVDVEKGADAGTDRKVAPYLSPNVGEDRPSSIVGQIVLAKSRKNLQQSQAHGHRQKYKRKRRSPC